MLLHLPTDFRSCLEFILMSAAFLHTLSFITYVSSLCELSEDTPTSTFPAAGEQLVELILFNNHLPSVKKSSGAATRRKGKERVVSWRAEFYLSL